MQWLFSVIAGLGIFLFLFGFNHAIRNKEEKKKSKGKVMFSTGAILMAIGSIALTLIEAWLGN